MSSGINVFKIDLFIVKRQFKLFIIRFSWQAIWYESARELLEGLGIGIASDAKSAIVNVNEQAFHWLENEFTLPVYQIQTRKHQGCLAALILD
jgi:hypothetical protein